MNANLKLCRVTGTLTKHERRRGHHPNRPIHDRDILRSLAYWRQVRHSGTNAAAQYLAHRAAAFGGAV